MIEFFQFLNSCSPLRAVTYMSFILIFIFLTYGFIDGIVTRLTNKNVNNEDVIKSGDDLKEL